MSPILKACSVCGRRAREGNRCDDHKSLAGPTSSRYRWQKLRKVVMARDGFRCLQCGATADLTVHIDPDLGGDHDRATADDCITLCRSCHGRIDQLRGEGL